VAHETPVSVMFPMVSTLDELLEARRRLQHVIELDGRGTPDDLQVGIMVEVPATALKAEAFAPHLDFFSIGTNDLTQYALAAERGNPAVAAIGDPLDPGVLRLVDSVCRAASGRCLVAVCGELAADEKAAALLVALGIRELSVAPASAPRVKQAVRLVAAAPDHDLLPQCLTATGPAEVRALLR
jgi:phosphocarrier protein FPr